MERTTEKIEEALEKLWINTHESGKPVTSCPELVEVAGDDGLADLQKTGYVESTAEGCRLTPAGDDEGRKVVRRHRLAEKLLSEVFGIEAGEMEEVACLLEHNIRAGFEDKICMLLGHPTTCPHGRRIPPGDCCTRKHAAGDEVIPMARLKKGQRGKVAYLQGMDQHTLKSMTAMGILPGVVVTVKQTFPSFLFELGNSEFAVDAQVAATVFVRIES